MHGFIGISISDVGFLLQYYPTSSIRHLKSGDDKIHYIVCQSVVKSMFLGMRSQEKHAAFSKNRSGIKRKRLIITRLSIAFSTQTRYKPQKSQENKRIYFPYYQLFAYFLFSPFLPYFARFLLFSTLLVHFEISFSFVPLQYRKTKENQLFSVITRLRYLNRDKTSKQWQS